MANSVQIGDLVVRLIADAKQLEAGLKQAGTHLDKFDGKVKQTSQRLEASFASAGRQAGQLATRLVGLAAAFVGVNSVISSFQRVASDTTALDNLSQATGISVERLSSLRGVALQLGIDFETVGRAASQFGTRMTQALASPTSQGSQALRALGIDVRDASGNIRSLDELLPELADSFSQFADGSNKAAIAAAIFGEEAGPRMIPLLNRGRAGLEELRNSIRRVVSPEDAERARDYQRAIGELQLAYEGLMQRVLTAIGPLLSGLANEMSQGVDELRRVTQAAIEFDRELQRLAQTSDRERETLDELRRRLQTLEDQFARGTLTLERFTSGTSVFTQRILEQTSVVERAVAAFVNLYNARRRANEPGAGEAGVEAAARPLTQAPPLDPFALERAQIVYQQMLERLQGTRSIFDEINFSWQEHSNIVQRVLSQIDKAHDQAHRRQAARYLFERTQQLRLQQQFMDTATVFGQTISALWPKQKGAAIAQAIINTSVGVMRAFATLDPPFSFITAALIAAQGAAQIATIRSTNEDGTGGGAAAPAPAPDTAASGRSLHISGVDPAHVYGGSSVRNLIEQINDEVRNGATLISTGTLPI